MREITLVDKINVFEIVGSHLDTFNKFESIFLIKFEKF